MSRTYRRKSSKSHAENAWKTYTEFTRNWYRNRNPGRTDEEIIHLRDVEYHCDNHPGEWSPPSGYGKALNRKVKRDNRLNLIRCLRNDEEFVEIPLKKDSGHDYF